MMERHLQLGFAFAGKPTCGTPGVVTVPSFRSKAETKCKCAPYLGASCVSATCSLAPLSFIAVRMMGVPLVWLDRNGRFKARLEGPVSGNVSTESPARSGD